MARSKILALLVLLGVVGTLALGLPGTSSGAGAQGPPPDHAERILVLSLPGLTWADVQDHDLPNIEAFFEDAALADLAPRGVSARSTPGEAYLTISAGSRAASDQLVDGQQLAVDQQSAGSTAGEIFGRRTGTEPDGTYVSLPWPTLERVNDAEPFDTELGLLAETLGENGRGVAAIGNADGSDAIGPSYERQVGLAAVTGDGVVPAGELGHALIVDDPARPFGERLDVEAVVDEFGAAWASFSSERDGGMVLVESSDLARTMRYRDRVSGDRYEQLWAQALADSDALAGRLLASVDPERDAVLMVAPYNLSGDRDLVAAALREPGPSGRRSEERVGRSAGYLRSASTQREPFLTLVDVAPTILDQLGIGRPSGMEGRPAEVVRSDASLESRVDRLVTENDASRFREQLLLPTTVVVVVVLAAVCAAAVVVIARGGWPQVSPLVTLVALADLAVLPLSFVARAFPLEDLGIGFYWAFVLVGAAAVAGVARVLGARWRRPGLALVAVLSLVLLVPVLDALAGSNLSLGAAFGYSPTGNSRLYGISNYSFGMVAGAGCLLAGLLAARHPPRRRRVEAVGLLLALLVVIGAPVWGSDVGGVLAFTPAVLLFGVLLWQGRVRLRTVLIAGLAAVGAVVAFGLADLARPANQRAHLGRLFERIGDEGLQPLINMVDRKLAASVGVTTSSFWVAAIPIAVVFIVFLARWPGRPLAALRRDLSTLQAGLVAAYVAALLGSVANDSGAITAGVAMAVVAAALTVLVLERPRAAPPAPEPAAANGAVTPVATASSRGGGEA